MMQKIQKFGGAMFTPVLLFAFAGVVIGVGTLFTTEAIMGSLAAPSSMWYQCWNVVLQGGWTVFNQLPLLFVVGLPIGMAKKQNARCCMEALVLYLTFHYFLSTILAQWGPTFGVDFAAEVGGTSGLTMIANIKTLDMGMIGALIISGIVIYLHNKFFDTELPEWLGTFSGSTFIFMIGFFVLIPVAVLSAFVWPKVQTVMLGFQAFVKGAGALGVWVFVFLERALIPFGLHHILYSPFWYDNVLVPGGLYAYWATKLPELAASSASLRSLVPEAGFSSTGFSKIFGCAGVALAFYKTAKPEKRKKTLGLLIPITLTAIFCGVTEPIEFTFLFIAPALFILHCGLAGLSFLLCHLLNICIGTTFSCGLIDFTLYGLLQGPTKTNWPMMLVLFVIYAIGYYLIFSFLIKKFNIMTPGREENSTNIKLYTKEDLKNKNNTKSELILEGVGGVDNLVDIDACATRLRLTVVDENLVNEELLKESGAKGVIKKGKGIQIIYGPQVTVIKSDFEEYVEKVSQ